MKARPDSLTYRKHEAAAREIERECELRPVASVLVKDRDTPRPERRARDWEGFRGTQTGITPDAVKAEVTALWKESGSGAEFRTALAEKGYLLCKGDRRDYCIIDPAGNDHSLARRIDGVRAADIRQNMNDIERDALPSVAVGRRERRVDKSRVAEAVAHGASKNNIARALDGGRVADIALAPQADDGGESGRRRELNDYTFARRHKNSPARESSPGKRPSWQERLKRESELER